MLHAASTRRNELLLGNPTTKHQIYNVYSKLE
jgi:hypothetical protein